MKKLFLILINLLFSIVVWSQGYQTFNKISEIEMSNYKNSNGPLVNNCEDMKDFITLEDHLFNFDKRYGLNKLQFLLNAIENNTVVNYISKLKNRNEATYADHLRLIITESKTAFVYKGKIYVLTYERTKRTNSFGVESEIEKIHKRKLYLYCKNNNVWIEVSGPIDIHVKNINLMIELSPGSGSYKPNIIINDNLIIINYYVTIWTPKLNNNKTHYHKEKREYEYNKNSTLYTNNRE